MKKVRYRNKAGFGGVNQYALTCCINGTTNEAKPLTQKTIDESQESGKDILFWFLSGIGQESCEFAAKIMVTNNSSKAGLSEILSQIELIIKVAQYEEQLGNNQQKNNHTAQELLKHLNAMKQILA